MIVFFIGSVTSLAWYCCKTNRITSSKSQWFGGRSLSGMMRVTMLYVIFVHISSFIAWSWNFQCLPSKVHKDTFPTFPNVQVDGWYYLTIALKIPGCQGLKAKSYSFLISKGASKYSVWFSAPVAMSLQKRVYLFEFWHLRSLVTDQAPLSRHHINLEKKPNAVSGEVCSTIFKKQTRGEFPKR